MRRRIATAIPIVTCALTLSLGATPALADGSQLETQDVGLLFTQSAQGGTLKPVQGKPGRFHLRLTRPAAQVVWFSDRPARHAGQIPIGGFVHTWGGFGFSADPPNAALTLTNAKQNADTVVLELTNPRYRSNRDLMSYRAQGVPAATGNLSDFEHLRDGRIARHFEDASLFIDDATAPVIDGCTGDAGAPCYCAFEPYTSCENGNFDNANLGAVDVRHARLDGATFSGAYLNGANFTNASVRYVQFDNGNLVDTAFNGANADTANFGGANLTGASFNDANVSTAEFHNAALNFVTFINANLTYADLVAANIEDADFTGATFCNTTMPDGSTSNPMPGGCPSN